MIRINQIKLPVGHAPEALEQKIIRALKIPQEQMISYEIVRKSLDARQKPELYEVYAVDVTVASEKSALKKVNDKNIMSITRINYQIPTADGLTNKRAPIVIGAGPAGLFCAYALVLSGLRPVVIERGKTIAERTKDVLSFWETGILNTESNVSFGEGGAGTFSDGKLNTLVKDPAGRNRFVLETFVKFGAPERILYENKPHIGTDVLAEVITSMRSAMERAGATFLFGTCMTDYGILPDGGISVELDHTDQMQTDDFVLAIGHSARDTFRMLAGKGQLAMAAKPFAVGFRVEHPQEAINQSQYGEAYDKRLPAAPYKVTANLRNGRGVYSFCMCPGGYVVNASSESGRLAVNGMSYSRRDGKNANSAIIVSVIPDDFDGTDALAGVRFQEILEERAYRLGKGAVPQQLFGDFCKNRASESYGSFQSAVKGAQVLCNLRGLLPEVLETSLIEGMHRFGRMIPGFDREDAILSGVESRTSSPVRITRDETFCSPVKGIYPCGEGAGYAGGIMSAAMDGLKVAEAILKTGN